MNRSQSKYFHTALLMDEALLQLLETKDLQYITVKEICEKAGVNRSTFYLHYETVGDLLAECLDEVKKRFFASFAHSPEAFIGNIATAPLDELILVDTELLRPFLRFFKENRSLFRAVHQNPACMQIEEQYNGMSAYILRPIMKRFHIPDGEQKYWVRFFVSGAMAVVREWFDGGCRESVEEIVGVLMRGIRAERKG